MASETQAYKPTHNMLLNQCGAYIYMLTNNQIFEYKDQTVEQ